MRRMAVREFQHTAIEPVGALIRQPVRSPRYDLDLTVFQRRADARSARVKLVTLVRLLGSFSFFAMMEYALDRTRYIG